MLHSHLESSVCHRHENETMKKALLIATCRLMIAAPMPRPSSIARMTAVHPSTIRSSRKGPLPQGRAKTLLLEEGAEHAGLAPPQ